MTSLIAGVVLLVIFGLLFVAMAAVAEILDFLDERREQEILEEERRQALRSWAWREVTRHDNLSVW